MLTALRVLIIASLIGLLTACGGEQRRGSAPRPATPRREQTSRDLAKTEKAEVKPHKPHKRPDSPKPKKDSPEDLLSHYRRQTLRTADGDSLPYRLLDPVREFGADDSRPLPLIIFLHGLGSGGTDNDRQLDPGTARYFAVDQDKYPAYVAFPQCPTDVYWGYPQYYGKDAPDKISMGEEASRVYPMLMNMIDTLVATRRVDPRRVVLVGKSMGGFGVLDLAARNPGRFSAVAAVAGGLNPARARNLLPSRLWIETAMDDDVVKPELSLVLIDTLQAMGAKLTPRLYKNGGHAAMHFTRTPDLLRWAVKATPARPHQPR